MEPIRLINSKVIEYKININKKIKIKIQTKIKKKKKIKINKKIKIKVLQINKLYQSNIFNNLRKR